MTSPTTPTGVDLASGDDPAGRWQVLQASTDAAQRARVDTAAGLADAAVAAAARVGWLRPRAGTEVLDASGAWARVALMWHQVLTDIDTFTRARSNPHSCCRMEADQVRSWLTSTDGETTVAARLGLDEYFDLYGFDKWVRITNLVNEAQQAGVYGVPGHRIEILHLAGERGFVDQHRVTLATPRHGTLCTGDIDTVELLTDKLSGVDAAVHALSVIAERTDQLLTDRALLADATWPAPTTTTTPDQARQPAGTDTTVGSPALATSPAPQPSAAGQPSTASAVPTPVARVFRPLALDPPATAASIPAAEAPARAGRRHR